MKKIFTVSLVAIMAATAANADIASTKYVTDRTGTTANLTTTAKELTGAVNELKTKLDTVAGDSTTSVGEQITAAKTELQGKIDDVAGDLADYEAANDKALEDGLALKEDKANKVTSFSDTNASDTTYPSTSAVKGYVSTSVSAVNTDLEATQEALGALTTTVTNNKTAADTGIQEAKDAAADALTDAKAYADAQDTAQTTTITNAYKAADSALETSLKAYADAEDKKIEDSIGTVEQGKTVVQMITEAKEAASGDAGEVASDLADYKTSNDAAVAAAKKAGDDAQADLNAYKTSNNAAVAKAQTDAVASAKTYTDGEIDKVEAAYAAADTALETSLQSYADQAEADAKTYGNNTFQVKSSALSVGAANGAWTDLTAATGYSTTGTHSLVLKNGVIQWELVDYGEDKE